MNYRHAIITGASSGIGRALALRLATRGVRLTIASRRIAELKVLAAEIEGVGGHAEICQLDVSDPDVTQRTIREIDQRVGGVDLVIANAGVSARHRPADLSWERCKNVINTNVCGGVATLVALVPQMVERGSGHLVGVSSLAQYRGLPRAAAYCASKAFLSTFLEGLRIDLSGTGVTVTDIRPGFVKTAMTATNQHPMPFLMELPPAVDLIENAILKKKSVLTFPWQLATVMRTARLLPNTVYDPAVRRARGEN